MSEPVEPIRNLVRSLCKRPGMYVTEPYFDCVCAYLSGYDDAQSSGALAGLREWLVVKANDGDNLVWYGLVRMLIRPNLDIRSEMTKEENVECVTELGLLLEEFFEYRNKYGLTVIHYDYARWLLAKRWYDGPLRKQNGKG
jgi:hypothetical protein